jgi:multiple sugar transport system substrate-binding protein
MLNKVLRKRYLHSTVALMMMGGVLAGCGDTNTNGTTTPAPAEIAQPKSPADVKGTATLWTWDKATEDASVAEFNKVYPNVKINVLAVGYDDYINKVQTSIAAGSELGDILMAESGFRARLLNMNLLDDLEAAPYKVAKSNFLDYVSPITTFNGKMVGYEGNISVGGLAYKAPLAKQYLGTDSPSDLEKRLNSWDAMVTAAKEVQEKSSGRAYLFHAWADIQEYFDSKGSEPWTKDNKPTDYLLNQLPSQRYKVLKEMLAAKGFDKAISDHYTPAMNAALGGDNHVFINAATWTPAFVIQPNDKNGNGKWRIMEAPGGVYNMGGALYGIWKGSKNKEAAFTYLNWAFGTKEGAEANVKARGYFPPVTSFVESHDFSKDANPTFAPQNIAEKFIKEMAPKNKVRAPELYTNQIKEAFKVAETTVINDNSITEAQYKEILVKEIKNRCPDLQW